MDENQYEKFIKGMGALTETCLLFYRNAIQAGATVEEATAVTSALIIGLFNNAKNKEQDPNS